MEASACGEKYPAADFEPLVVPDVVKERLRLLYVAKHARSSGRVDGEDGTHAVYHAEIREVLEDIGFNVETADDYRVLFEQPDIDFVFPLLNRSGFLNSEMMLPLLCNRLGIPYLGGSPIIRGMSTTSISPSCSRAPAAFPRQTGLCTVAATP